MDEKIEIAVEEEIKPIPKKRFLNKTIVLSILLFTICVASLVGTTFAWFSDNETSANNVIMTGKLDVELYYQLEGQTEWTPVKADTELFTNGSSWLPGHSELVRFKIVNEGNLPLNYRFGVNVVDESGSKNSDDVSFLLSEFIKFGVIESDTLYTKEGAIAEVSDRATTLETPFVPNLTLLLPEGEGNTDFSDIVTMIVYMPEGVGNEANAALGQPKPTISLGINLYATQVID